MEPTPQLRPSVGFCVQTESTGSPPGRWFVNMCKHRIVDMPLAPSGQPASKEWILRHGLSNLQIPFDAGTFRKVKARADGAKQTTYVIDVIFNPFIIQMFMDDEFNKTMEQYREFILNLALKRIDESVGVRLSSSKVKLMKGFRYKDAEDDDGVTPKAYVELEGTEDCFDAEAPPKPAPKQEEAAPLIEDVTPASQQKPAMKKGFLNSSKAKGSLYGEGGSTEGVLPENAGDPMGWMPKKLRTSCKIVDCNDPGYQKSEAQRKSAEASNAMNSEFKDGLLKDMDKWAKAAQPDKWMEDLPDGTDEPSNKYDVDYSRFDKIDDEDAGPTDDRDWYCDADGKVRWMDGREIKKTSAAAPAAAAAPATAAGQGAGPAVKKGFLDNAKTALYPEGSSQGSQAKAPMDEASMMKELSKMMGGGGNGDDLSKELEKMMGGDASGLGDLSKMKEMLGGGNSAELGKELEKMMGGNGGELAKAFADLAKAGIGEQRPEEDRPDGSAQRQAPERRTPDFELGQVADGLQLAVDVPGLTSMQGVDLNVTERQANLAFPSSVGLKPLQVDLPSAVRPTEVRAKFSKKTHRITITLPVACN